MNIGYHLVAETTLSRRNVRSACSTPLVAGQDRPRPGGEVAVGERPLHVAHAPPQHLLGHLQLQAHVVTPAGRGTRGRGTRGRGTRGHGQVEHVAGVGHQVEQQWR